MVAKKPKKTMKKQGYIALAAIALVVILGMVASSNLEPVLLRMAEARARALAVEVINQSVREVVGAEMSYSDLVHVVTDNTGRVAMLQANTVLMNDLATRTAIVAQKKLSQLEDQGVKLPLGSVLGAQIFAGMGPSISVRIVPVGSVTTWFNTTFESAGINQTRHEISMESTTLVRIVVPTGGETVEVRSKVPVAESIIVGDVPDTFIGLSGSGSPLNMSP